MKRSPHVCIVSCQHPPDDKRVTHKIAMAMRGQGFRVTWVGPAHGRYYGGSTYGMEMRTYPPSTSKGGRLLHHHRRAFTVGLAVPDVDVFFAVEPDSAAVAVALAKIKRARAVFDIHEVYHDEMLGRWASARWRKAASLAVRGGISAIAAQCDLLVGVSRTVLEPYRHLRTPQIVVRSCAPASFANGAPADVCGPGRQVFTLMHGKSAAARGTGTVVRAMGIAARKAPRLRVIVFNSSAQQPDARDASDFRRLVEECGADDVVDLRPSIPIDEMPGVLRGCDAGIIAYDRNWGVRSLPNRLFEFMALGLPIIAPSYSEEIRPIIESERCGVLVDCEDPYAIAEAVLQLRDDPEETRAMGMRGRDAFLNRYNWAVEVLPLLAELRAGAHLGATAKGE